MIEMAVGIKKKNRFQIILSQIPRQLFKFFPVIASTVNDCTFSGVITHNKGVNLDG